jgi:hypothetical protein
MFTVAFWKAAAERAFKSAAQMVLLAIGASEAGPGNLFELDWQNVVGAGVFGVVISTLTSIVSASISDGKGPSLAPAAEIEANSAT